nr:Gfo/Idh/MocA family oxidoreductase [Syntrophomonas palmitatica]
MPQEGFARLDKNGHIPKPQNWRLEDGSIPTISLDLGVHLHHITYFLSEEKPLDVVADQSTYGHFQNVVDNVMCIARYTGNLRTQIWYSKCALGNSNGLRVRVYGSHGSAEWFQMRPEELIISDIKGKHEILDRAGSVCLADELRYNRFKAGHPAGFIEAFANLYYDIADSLIDFNEKGYYNSPYVFDAVQAVEGLEMMEAINKSAQSRSWQAIMSSLNAPAEEL